MEIRNLFLGIIHFPDSIYSFDNIDKVGYGACLQLTVNTLE